MKVCYDKLWKLLIDKKLKRTDLIKNANISSNVLARMGHEEPVSLDSIGKICEYLGCNPSCEECPYGVFEQNNRERNDWQNTLNEILELYGIDEENMPLF